MKIQAALLALTFSLTVSCQSARFDDQPGFATPETVFEALVQSVRISNLDRLRILLGPSAEGLLGSGDEMKDSEDRRRFLELYDEQHTVEMLDKSTAVLSIGEIEWPFPIPAAKQGRSWYLDTEEGYEELLDRRIGKNELSTVEVCLALVDAQLEYVAQDWDGNGLFEYAQQLQSSEGRKDGLYWPTEDGQTPSPIGTLFAAASSNGRANADEMHSYHGYRYRLLKAQGEHASGGAYSYMAGDSMIGGFAVVAYPAEYGETGVISFMTSHDGVLYECDLGADGEATAESMSAFDPDEAWTISR